MKHMKNRRKNKKEIKGVEEKEEEGHHLHGRGKGHIPI
jgi:hypothetical protein